MRKASILAGARGQDLAWIGAADVQETLAGRERSAGGGLALLGNNGIGGRPAFASKMGKANCVLVGRGPRWCSGFGAA